MDVTKFDRFQRLAFFGKLPVAIMGNSQTADYELFRLGGELPAQLNDASERGLELIGVVAVVDGEPKSELTTPLGATTIAALSNAYCKLIGHALRERLECDSLQMLYEYDA